MLTKAVVILWSVSSVVFDLDNPKRFVDNSHGLAKRVYNVSHPFASKEVPSDFNSIQKLLNEERDASQLYNEVWEKAVKEFKNTKDSVSSKYFKETTPDECYIAIIAYTLDTDIIINGTEMQLYRDFNGKFRALTDEASWDRFPYKSLFYLLNKAVPGVRNKPNPDQDSFRGIENFHFNPVPKIGDNFFFDSFASCSTDRGTAEVFMGDDGTLVELDGGAAVAIGIAEYSPYDEDEVLVFPKNKFRVKKFKRSGTKDFLVLERAGVVMSAA